MKFQQILGLLFFFACSFIAFMGNFNENSKSLASGFDGTVMAVEKETKNKPVSKKPSSTKTQPVILNDICTIRPIPNGNEPVEPTYIEIKFTNKIDQKFNFEISPKLKTRVLISDKIIVVVIDGYYDYDTGATYVCKLTSPKPFIYNKDRNTELSWYFKTFDEILFDPPLPPHMINQPIDIYLPNDASNFKIARRINGTVPFEISLIGVFNAGINGPPISYQRKEYYKDIAQAKKDALKWIVAKGQNPTQMKIKWVYPKY